MAFNVANLDSSEWLYTLFNEEYLINEANKQSNYFAFMEVIYSKLNENNSLNEFSLPFDENNIIQQKNNIDEILNNMTKIEKKRAMKKASKKIQNKEFIINLLKKIQNYYIQIEKFNKSSYAMSEILISDRFVRYYCMTSNIYNNILNKQTHIPFIFIKDKDFLKFSYERKYFYGMNEREKENFKENAGFLNNLLDDIDYDNFDDEKVEFFLKKRFNYMYKRCEDNNWVLPKIELYRDIFKDNFDNGFKCEYCNTPLRFEAKEEKKGAKNFEDLFTFEHRKPLSKGGVHSRDNLIISCMCCNIIKADMEEELFLSILKSIDNDTKYKLYEHSYFKHNLISDKFNNYKGTIIKLKNENKNLKNENKLLLNKF